MEVWDRSRDHAGLRVVSSIVEGLKMFSITFKFAPAEAVTDYAVRYANQRVIRQIAWLREVDSEGYYEAATRDENYPLLAEMVGRAARGELIEGLSMEMALADWVDRLLYEDEGLSSVAVWELVERCGYDALAGYLGWDD